MAWPTVAVDTTGMDADTDALPRSAILDLTTKFNELIAMRGVASGVCDLDASGVVPVARIPAAIARLASPALTGTPTAPTATAGTNTTQLATTAFVQAAAQSAVPAGMIAYFGMRTPPTGWLELDGAVISTVAYPELTAAIYCGDADNATAPFGYKTSDSAGTTRNTAGGYIVLQDARGEFIRGWDNGRGVDSGRVFGSWQVDEFESHFHELAVAQNVAGSGQFGPNDGTYVATVTGYKAVSNAGGTETRGRNLAFLTCIKY